MRLRAGSHPPFRASRMLPASLRKGLAGAVLVLALPGVPFRAQEASTNRADYRIEARLDGDTKRLDGKLELRWTNRSGEAVKDLWFHLYLNAFSNNRSTHLSESDGKLRGKEIEDGWGWSRILGIRVAGAENG